MKISVIMPSYLSNYDGCAKNREKRFCLAIESFLSQTHNSKELLIVSHGCELTDDIYKYNYSNNKDIRFFKTVRNFVFEGATRQKGIENATGNVITYLDTDDIIGKNHLSNIAKFIKNYDWIFYADIIKISKQQQIVRVPELAYSKIGTSNLSHINKPEIFNWIGCDHFGHDYKFITEKLMKSNNFSKVYGCQYYVCHSTGHDYYEVQNDTIK